MASLSKQERGNTDIESASGNLSAQTDADSRLRWTVRQLGNVLGETIVEQEGQAIFDLVEDVARSDTRPAPGESKRWPAD